jgi:hypothetical protein
MAEETISTAEGAGIPDRRQRREAVGVLRQPCRPKGWRDVDADRPIGTFKGPPADGLIGPTWHDAYGASPPDDRHVKLTISQDVAVDLDLNKRSISIRPLAQLIDGQDVDAILGPHKGAQIMSLDPWTWSIGREYPAGVVVECPSVLPKEFVIHS